ncbi:2Fe-2S iron-sulfur cluster-binding protein [Streptomyces gilvosporeus]|uniref:2Fe-2S ferredoxin-type domain-containing protein n=1 Tax=Streptomyces gilvosporeus TaxID=553510 RepID=A0A1V0TRF0_9ACTN|nr:2Fe-2S iron-sulfur cluster-binding protein [Streptomyces gilvosporeus]ARF55529.1 hypothetical protein B1H19_16290 [Streptomyces gilvosporeus]
MSEENHTPQQPHPDHGWQPLPQGGEYEQEATAFVQLPEGFTTGGYRSVPGYNPPGTEPLAAPGHGYTPPDSFTRHTPEPSAPATGTDPASTAQWTMPFADRAAGYADPSAGYPAHNGHSGHSGHQEHPGHSGHQEQAAIYQGGAPEGAPSWGGDQVDWPVAGSPEAAGGAGAWSVPAAADDVLEESGEYLVGEDGLTGYQGHQSHPGQQGHPAHPATSGHQEHGAPVDYQGGYQDTYGGAEAPADAAGTGRTGHWNFAAGLSATTAPGHGEAATDSFGASGGDPYAAEGGPAGGGEAVDGDPYGTAVGEAKAPEPGATGHWSLPADALAQWPPAQQEQEAAPRPEEAAPSIGAGHAPGGEPWTVPVAEGEAPEHSGEFAVGPSPAQEAGPTAATGDAYAAYEPYETYDHPREAAGTEQPVDGDVPAAQVAVAGAEPRPEPEDAAEAGPAAAPAPEEAPQAPQAQDAPQDVHEAARPQEPDGPVQAPDPVGQVDLTGEPAVAEDPGAPAPDAAHDEHPAASYVLRVNGTDRPVTDSWIGESLLYVLRERLGLAGAKDGCSQGECGACSVQVDGRLVASCLVPAATTAGSDVRTVEGLAQDGVPSDVQRALAASGAVQCGFCVPGMAMTVHDLLEGNHAPSELETRKALCGNLCRCSGYRGVLDAVAEVVQARAEAAEAAHAADEAPADALPETPRIPHQAGPSEPTGHTDAPGHHPHQGPGADSQTGGAA